jgi:hypothetical protein
MIGSRHDDRPAMAALAASHDHFDFVTLVKGELVLSPGVLMASRTLVCTFVLGRHVLCF